MSSTLAQPVSEAPPAGDSLAADVDRLREQLVEKDDLVALLTDRLEQAVERLDRLKREGAKPQSASPTGTLQTDVERLVNEWDAAELPVATQRIEDQIASLKDFIAEELRAVTVQPPETAAQVSSTLDGWEAMKASLLSDDGEPLGDVPDEEPASAEPEQTIEPLDVPDEPIAAVVPETPPEVEPDPLPPGPAALDLNDDTLDRETLVAAVQARDDYIIGITQRALDRRAKLEVPTDWTLLRTVPGELVKNVQRLHDQLDEAVRMAEVQLCLERAKLSRERTELEQLRADAAVNQNAADEPEETTKERRWRRMLGK